MLQGPSRLLSLDLTYASEFRSMIDKRAIFSSGFSLESQHTPRKVQNDVKPGWEVDLDEEEDFWQEDLEDNLDNWKEDGYDTGVDDEVVEN